MRAWYTAPRNLMLTGLIALMSASAVVMPAYAAPAVSAADPSTVVSGLNGNLLSIMQNAQKLGYKGRYAALEPIVRQVFNIEYMTRIAVGSGWATLSTDQQVRLTDAFREFITA